MGGMGRVVSMAAFAEAMLVADGDFARRVADFKARFGKTDEDTLCVMAQALYFCRVNHEVRRNLFDLCRAVRSGKPTSLYLHCQVTPERWDEIHAYVVGVQRWLGVDLPVPDRVDDDKVRLIAQWLGGPHPAKQALADLFLYKLVDDCLNYLSLARLGVEADAEGDYVDYSAWYAAADGTPYARPHRLAPGDGGRWTWDNDAMKPFVEERKRRVREAMAPAAEDADELIRWVLTLTQPPCMHRFTRYMDIQLAAIGALKWRGSVPPDDVPRSDWQAFLDDAMAALQDWVAGRPPSTALAVELHSALGSRMEEGAAIVGGFLLPETSANMGVSWDWLVPKADADGTSARWVFNRHRPRESDHG